MKNRLRKSRLYAKVLALKQARHWMTDEEFMWEFTPPGGLEFGSSTYTDNNSRLVRRRPRLG